MEKHTTVLLDEGVDALAIKPTGTYVDATLGAHGHAERIIEKLQSGGTYIGIDADPIAVKEAEEALTGKGAIRLITGNFRDIDTILEREGVTEVDGILADLGWRMEQFSGNGKGFSFQVNEPLVMTYGVPETYSFTASDIVNTWDEENIISILHGYGEERYARRIARGIIDARERGSIQTTFDLTHIIESSVPGVYRHGRINPATRTFQALRMTVNDELGALEDFLQKAMKTLSVGGRLAVITFHSLEDRMVKHTFKAYAERGEAQVLTKKPLQPHEDEMKRNTRSRSAKLRILEKI
jgi:16S rRNA (cytosine1402-N4)-methyltransferase